MRARTCARFHGDAVLTEPMSMYGIGRGDVRAASDAAVGRRRAPQQRVRCLVLSLKRRGDWSIEPPLTRGHGPVSIFMATPLWL